MLADDVRHIPYVNVSAQFAEERDDVMPLLEAALQRGDYVGGDAIQHLERDLQDMLHVRHALALKSGTDALIFALIALGIGEGHEVITPPNSFIASTSAIVHSGARPVFVDVGPDQNLDPHLIAQAITPRTRAIMPVHLTGRICEMDPISKIARDHGLAIVEDAAQSIGSRYRGRFSGGLGDVGCFSLHPLKNLNAAGDGGILTTDDDTIADRVRRLRNHGMQDRDTVVEFGYVSRLDTIQAVLVRYRLGLLGKIISTRRRNAQIYREALDRRHVFVPDERDDTFDTYHTFVVQVDRRDELKTYLAARGVGTAIHYPNPIHLQPAAKGLGYRRGDFPVTEAQAGRILTLPINPFVSPEDVRYVADQVNGFFAQRVA